MICFNKGLLKKCQFLVVVLCMCLILVGCKDLFATHEHIVPSFKEIYPRLHAKAQEWQEDAVLEYISCHLYTIEDGHQFCIADFRSSSADYVVLIVTLADGVITSKKVGDTHKEFYPIDLMSLPFDSTEILDLFLSNPQYEINEFYFSHYKAHADLSLNFNKVNSPNQLVWELFIRDWSFHESEVFRIDPFTGDYLERAP